jgi:ATP-dependent RNA helicase MSS116
MSIVQSQVLPLLPELANPHDPENPPKNPRDLLVRAKTGTGKTLGFLIPAVEARLKSLAAHAEKADESGLPTSRRLSEATQRKFAKENTGVVIISPTRELATQIAQEATKLVKHISDFGVHLFVGGESKSMQLREFRRHPHDIVVATPGRLKDILDSCSDVAESISHTQTVRIYV